MATITSAGIGSGLDIESLVSKLVAAERAPITQLTKKTDSLKTELSTFGKVQSSLATLRDAAAKLTAPASWGGTLATSSDTAVSVSAGSGAAIGNVSVDVKKLAQSQTLVSGTPFASGTTTVGQGSLTITLGAWASDADGNVTGFTDKAGATAITVDIGDGKDTLAGIRDAINAAGAGVTAAIVNDATGARLTLRSAASGETNGFRIEGTGALSDLGYDPRIG
ncbi:MAG: flagellar hook protein, partial [Oxalobacteraceae bacterium]